jgi:hypothetical protein
MPLTHIVVFVAGLLNAKFADEVWPDVTAMVFALFPAVTDTLWDVPLYPEMVALTVYVPAGRFASVYPPIGSVRTLADPLLTVTPEMPVLVRLLSGRKTGACPLARVIRVRRSGGVALLPIRIWSTPGTSYAS